MNTSTLSAHCGEVSRVSTRSACLRQCTSPTSRLSCSARDTRSASLSWYSRTKAATTISIPAASRRTTWEYITTTSPACWTADAATSSAAALPWAYSRAKSFSSSPYLTKICTPRCLSAAESCTRYSPTVFWRAGPSPCPLPTASTAKTKAASPTSGPQNRWTGT